MPKEDLSKVIAEQVAAALKQRDAEARKEKDPESMKELIDRISDVTVEKLVARFDDSGDGDEGDEGDEGTGERTPMGEHPFFQPLFGRNKSA